ncbi:MAG: DUF1616 domain-containing protein [Candidatus Bathyarchaeia archaeon]
MNFADVKLAYVFSCIALSLIILSPTLAHVVSWPEGEKFSELWILGPNRMAEGYPFNVSAGMLYRIYLGVGNHLGKSAYYKVYVKLRNQSEPLPNSTAGVPSPLEPIYEFHVFLADNSTWEREISFSFEQVSFNGNVCRIGGLMFDGHYAAVDKGAVWDAERNGFFIQLFFELWLYNADISDFEFHNRYVNLWFNMSTVS